ncbi:hypothetical protein [Akkermansia sp.]
MVECIEWSHEYMTAGNKPSYIDDAVNSVISSFSQPEKGIPEMPYILVMSILYHSQQCPPIIACILSIECSGLIGDAPYAYVEMQNLHMDSLSSVRLKVILLDSLPLLRGKNSGRILRKQGSLLLDSPLSKRDLKKLVSPGQVEHAVLKVSHKKIILTARSVRGDDSYWGDLTYALSQKYFPDH